MCFPIPLSHICLLYFVGEVLGQCQCPYHHAWWTGQQWPLELDAPVLKWNSSCNLAATLQKHKDFPWSPQWTPGGIWWHCSAIFPSPPCYCATAVTQSYLHHGWVAVPVLCPNCFSAVALIQDWLLDLICFLGCSRRWCTIQSYTTAMQQQEPKQEEVLHGSTLVTKLQLSQIAVTDHTTFCFQQHPERYSWGNLSLLPISLSIIAESWILWPLCDLSLRYTNTVWFL